MNAFTQDVYYSADHDPTCHLRISGLVRSRWQKISNDLSSKSDVLAAFYTDHLIPFQKNNPSYFKISDVIVCTLCLAAPPSCQLGCGHLYCPECVNQIMERHHYNKCIFCNALIDRQKISGPPELPPLAGPRILTLDGSGARAIVMCRVLQKISARTGTNIRNLFDLVGGTSGGGLLALSIFAGERPYPLHQLIEHFKTIPQIVFPRIWSSFFNILMFSSIYTHEGLENAIDMFFNNNELMMNASQSCHLFVTSTKIDQTSSSLAIFPTYVPTSDQRRLNVHYERIASIHTAAKCTASAPLYFPPVSYAGHAFADGGLLANNPVEQAYFEAQHLYPDKPVSVIISLGNNRSLGDLAGQSDYSSSDHAELQKISPWRFLSLGVKVLTDVDEPINRLLTHVDREKLIRISPVLEQQFQLNTSQPDAMEDMDRQTENWLNRNSFLIENAALRILASSIYVSPFEIAKGKFRAQLKTRFEFSPNDRALFSNVVVRVEPNLKDGVSTFSFEVSPVSISSQAICNICVTLCFPADSTTYVLHITAHGLPISGFPRPFSDVANATPESGPNPHEFLSSPSTSNI